MDETIRTAVDRWLIKAGHDLAAAEALLDEDPPIVDVVCFHSQQCVEKCLKAFLVCAGAHVVKTHDLARLVSACSRIDLVFDELLDTALDLTVYAVTDRYPDNWREIPVAEAADALEKARSAVEFVKARIRDKGGQ